MCNLSKSGPLLLLLIVILTACAPIATSAPPVATPAPPVATNLPPTLSATAQPTVPPAPPTPSTQSLAADLDKMMQRVTKAGLFSGAVLVARNGEVILSQGYGLADRDREVPNTPQTKFRIASLTKQFTAMAIMLLQAQGKLTVQDKICQYLKDCPASWASMTIHQLLTHTSGLPDIGYEAMYTEPFTSPVPAEQLVAEAKIAPLDFEPGTSWQYSNVGYGLLGRIIEAVSGQPYAAYVQQHIFEPLGMSNTGLAIDTLDLAVGYDDKVYAAAGLNGWVLYSSGGLYSTVEDLYKWDQALWTDRLVSPSILDTMFTAHAQIPDAAGLGYGYGWTISPPDQARAVFHFGGVDGFTSYIGRYLDTRLTIIVVTNQGDVAPDSTGELIYKKVLAQ